MKKRTKNCCPIMSYKQFLDKNKLSWWIMGIALLISYGIKVFNVSISHDTEAIISVSDDLYNSWYALGRFGLILLKKVLDTYCFNPFVASFLMLVTMLINGIVWAYLFAWLGQKKDMVCRNTWVFPVVFFTSTIMAEQSAFLLQAYEVNVALLMLGLALINAYACILNEKKWYFFLPSCIFCILAFSCYQSFVPLFTAGAAICFLKMYDAYATKSTDISYDFLFRVIGKLVAVFLTSFALYMVINKLVLSIIGIETHSYITDQIKWGTIPFMEGVKNVLRHVYRVLTGESIFYSSVFAIVCLTMLTYVILRIREKLPCYSIYILAVLFCFFSPFLMTVLMGEEPNVRTQILLPFMSGALLQYLLDKISVKESKVLKWTYVVAMSITVWFSMHQSILSAKLYYTQYVQYEEDVRTAIKISTRIDALDLGEIPVQPVVFVGKRTPQMNAVCFENSELSLIGRSFFEVSFSTTHGTWVMSHFMDSIGYSYNSPTQEQIMLADEIARDMPVWPYSGCVIEKDGIIIVKLG